MTIISKSAQFVMLGTFKRSDKIQR